MPLTEMQIKAAELIASDPEAMRMLQQQVDRLDPQGRVIPKSALPDIMFDKKIEDALKPLKEQNEQLRKELEEKNKTDLHMSQREYMKREYKLNDEKVDDLVKWMEQDADGNLFKSYEAAYRYRMAMSQPTLPNGTLPTPQKISPLSGRVIGSESWREQFKDPKHALRQSRAEAKQWAQQQWAEADREFFGKK